MVKARMSDADLAIEQAYWDMVQGRDRVPLPMWDAMRRGHLVRTGHALVGYLIPAGGGTHELVRECC